MATADIQAGIERHIEEQIRLGEGHFRLPFGDRELRLNLVRVHTEYLSNLGSHRYFACVDFKADDGTMVDVDFYFKDDDGAWAEITSALDGEELIITEATSVVGPGSAVRAMAHGSSANEQTEG